MKIAIAIATAAALVGTNAWAASQGTLLAPGKPAGLHQAQREDDGTGMLIVAGAALIGITIALAMSNNNASSPVQTSQGGGTSTSTSTTGTTS
jgi:hypothetical protein